MGWTLSERLQQILNVSSNFQIMSQKHRAVQRLSPSESCWQKFKCSKLSHFILSHFRIPEKPTSGYGTRRGINNILPWRLQEGSKPWRVSSSFFTRTWTPLENTEFLGHHLCYLLGLTQDYTSSRYIRGSINPYLDQPPEFQLLIHNTSLTELKKPLVL